MFWGAGGGVVETPAAARGVDVVLHFCTADSVVGTWKIAIEIAEQDNTRLPSASAAAAAATVLNHFLPLTNIN